MSVQSDSRVYVWDPFVRLFHWSLVVAFTISYLTGEGPLGLHVWSGYAIAGLLVARLIWGFIGSKRARFADFVYRPRAIIGYLRDLVTFRSKRYLGHSPAGGAMVMTLLIVLAITGISGILTYGVNLGEGPAAALYQPAVELSAGTTPPATMHSEEHEHQRSPLGQSLHGIHEFAANLALAVIIVHVSAILLVSALYRENLVRAMLTGFKRA